MNAALIDSIPSDFEAERAAPPVTARRERWAGGTR